MVSQSQDRFAQACNHITIQKIIAARNRNNNSIDYLGDDGISFSSFFVAMIQFFQISFCARQPIGNVINCSQ